jgi:quercetin dioxygenase-like cupin family protein
MAEKNTKTVSACEIGRRKSPLKKNNRTAFYKHKGDFCWTGVKDEAYKTKGSEWSNIIRKVLVGERGESAKFHLRYFEILPGGNSSLEFHSHEHVVVCVRGTGTVLTGKKKRTMEFMDTIYIAPRTVHQFSNPSAEPFGFICIVNSRRDRPKIL